MPLLKEKEIKDLMENARYEINVEHRNTEYWRGYLDALRKVLKE